ncbi:hypothetical protein [Histophilus somni]|uniref:hypothetical protein n=1 Tax=Histophilus somni TaxID=731 RepID=UPI00003974F2|nr:hypothetical protein [Histophilus somni]ACA31278.1 hypothetical protein HSM_1523 [Histophilus somni 2336]
MKKYTLEVKIAERGTSYKGHSSSVAGHIFYVLVDEHGNRKSFGWGKGENSTLGGIENITKTDDIDYSETNFGGSDDDMLYGGDGADTLLGEGGDDYLDGGEGEDVAEFSGNFADYKITKMGDGLLISDTKQGRDGTDFLRNIEKLNFKDITNYQVPVTNNFKPQLPSFQA